MVASLFEIGAFSRVPIIIGSNRDEGWTWVTRSFPGEMTQEQYETALATEFGPDAPVILQAYPTEEYSSPKDALAHAVTDAEYACGAARLSRLAERTNTAVYLYQFEYALDVLGGRAVHGLDVSFVFGTTVAAPVLPPPSTYPLSPDDLENRAAGDGSVRRNTMALSHEDDPAAVNERQRPAHAHDRFEHVTPARAADRGFQIDTVDVLHPEEAEGGQGESASIAPPEGIGRYSRHAAQCRSDSPMEVAAAP